MPPDSAGKAAVADWEEMFRTFNSYENVKANGRPSDKAWWIEQARRFLIGKALADQLEYIEFLFSPRSLGRLPAFIEDAAYTAQVQSCSSSTECTVLVRLQSGRFMMYDVHRKNWSQADPVEPAEWTVPMQYDPAASHWKIN